MISLKMPVVNLPGLAIFTGTYRLEVHHGIHPVTFPDVGHNLRCVSILLNSPGCKNIWNLAKLQYRSKNT